MAYDCLKPVHITEQDGNDGKYGKYILDNFKIWCFSSIRMARLLIVISKRRSRMPTHAVCQNDHWNGREKCETHAALF